MVGIKAQQPAQQEPVYLMESADGWLTRVPESKLEAWEAAQQGRGHQLSEETKALLREQIVSEIFGSRR